MINPNQLDTLFKDIENKLPNHLALPTVDGNIDKHMIYKISNFNAVQLEHSILFKINIPLVLDQKYDITHLISLPININNQSKHTKLDYEYIAISENYVTYTLFDKHDLDQCFTMRNSYICKLNHILFNIHVHKTCELNIKTENKLDLCKSINVNKIDEIYVRLQKPNMYLFALNKNVSIHIRCADNTYNKVINHIGVIDLRTNCILQTPSLTLFGQIDLLPTKIKHTTLTLNNTSDTIIQTNLVNTEHKLEPVILDNSKKLDEINVEFGKLNEIETKLKTQHYHNVHHYASVYVLIILACVCVLIIILRNKCKEIKIRNSSAVTKEEIPKHISINIESPTFPLPTPKTEHPTDTQTSENPRFLLKGGGVV